MKYGVLEEVNVRELWKHEQYDFSNWIAKDENIQLLNEQLGLTLVDVDKEVYVGSYRCDLFAIDESTGTKVIIENQLEKSNHDHLGKIITYASGLSASVIVWIVKEAREEHKSAIEWLNNNTNKEINFFLFEIHAFKIGDSLPAPKFEIIEKPNEFIKVSKDRGNSAELNKGHADRLKFWTSFNNVIAERGKPFSIRKASVDHWYDVAIGTTKAFINITLVNREGFIGVSLLVNGEDKELFDYLYLNKDEIESCLEFDIEWLRLDGKKTSRIIHKVHGLNFDDESNHAELMNEVINKVLQMKKAFVKYI